MCGCNDACMYEQQDLEGSSTELYKNKIVFQLYFEKTKQTMAHLIIYSDYEICAVSTADQSIQ